MTESLHAHEALLPSGYAAAPVAAGGRDGDAASPMVTSAPATEEDSGRLERFIRQLAARGGSSRCYWHLALWPAEDKGLIRATYEPVEMPRHRTRPIRQWCYRVTLTEKGWALVDALRSLDADSPEEGSDAEAEERL